MTTAEQITDQVVVHGEGPCWYPGWGGLRWVDMLAGDVMTLDATSGAIDRWHVGSVAAVVRPRVSGGAVLALERGFALAEQNSRELRLLEELWSDETVRLNEGGCDPDGRFYCGSMAYDSSPGRGTVYRLDADEVVSVVIENVTISNGLEWSPDNSLAYYVDTPTGRIDVFDYDSENGLTGRRPFVEIPSEAGSPDGLTVDSEGAVWVALWGGSAVHRYSADGKHDGVVEVDATQVTACTFGGENLDELYITTSREPAIAKGQPAAGALFRADVGVRGMPVRPYAG